MPRPIENLGEAKSGGVSTDLIANSREPSSAGSDLADSSAQ